MTIPNDSLTTTPLDTFTGNSAPDFVLIGLDGKTHRLQDYRGKRLILNFWATWCAPCKLGTPLLEKTYRRLQTEGLVVVGVDQAEDLAAVSDFIEEFSLTYPILMDKDLMAAQAYDVVGLPKTFFIDAKGIIQAKNAGRLTPGSLQHYLDSLLAAASSQPTLTH